MKAMCAYGHTKMKCNANEEISRCRCEMQSSLQKGTILNFTGHKSCGEDTSLSFLFLWSSFFRQILFLYKFL